MKHHFSWLLALIILLPFYSQAQPLHGKKGLLDLREWNFKDNGPASLSGEWEFYMNELIAAEDFHRGIDSPRDYTEFPSLWNDVNKTSKPGTGYATYRLRVFVKAPQNFTFEVPHFYTSYNLFINQKLISSNGIVATSKETAKPQWLPSTFSIKADSDTMDIVVQVSNFHHANGGVREPILISSENDLLLKYSMARISNITLFGVLILLSIAFIFIYLTGKKDLAAFYFAALCFTWAMRSGFSNLYVVTSYIPDFSWELAVKIEYISLYLTMVFASLLLAKLFPADTNNGFKYFFSGCNGIFTIFTLFSNASVYTQFLPVYLSLCVVLLLYILYVLVRALVYERQGVWFIITIIALGVVIFSYDLISYQVLATFNAVIIHTGYLVMFVLLGVCMLYQLGFLKRSAGTGSMLTYEDLYGTPATKEMKR